MSPTVSAISFVALSLVLFAVAMSIRFYIARSGRLRRIKPQIPLATAWFALICSALAAGASFLSGHYGQAILSVVVVCVALSIILFPRVSNSGKRSSNDESS
jgi:hypothetical protein